MAEAVTAVDTAKFALLHTMIRVRDLERSIDFYTRHLGMKVLRHKDYPDGQFTNVFIGYGDEAILIKGYDSEVDGRARFTLHTAFDDPTTPADAAPRESIEVRVLAFFDA